MKGSEIAAGLSENILQRDQQIFDHIKNGNALLWWKPLTIDYGPVRARIFVTAQPIQLGEPGDSFRPSVTATTMQRIADLLSATMLTPKLVDEIWKQADHRIDPPVTMGSTIPMSTTQRMLDHDAAVNQRLLEKLGNYDPSQLLIANIGKYWVNSRHTSDNGPTIESGKVTGPGPAATNYGWMATGMHGNTVTAIPGVGMWQAPGYAHNYLHQDYSQLIVLASRSVELCVPATGVSGLGAYWHCKPSFPCMSPNGPGLTQCMDIYDIANDPKLTGILSHEGTINMRYPKVPFEDPGGCWLQDTSFAGLGSSDVCGPPPPAGPTGRGAPLVGSALGDIVTTAAVLSAGVAAGWFGWSWWEN